MVITNIDSIENCASIILPVEVEAAPPEESQEIGVFGVAIFGATIFGG